MGYGMDASRVATPRSEPQSDIGPRTRRQEAVAGPVARRGRTGHTPGMRDEASRTGDDRSDEQAPARPSEHGFGDLRHYVPSDLLNVSFPVAVRARTRKRSRWNIGCSTRVSITQKTASRASPPSSVESTSGESQPIVWPP